MYEALQAGNGTNRPQEPGRRPLKGQVMIGVCRQRNKVAWQLARALQGSSSCTPPLGWDLEGSGEYLNETTKLQGLVGKAPAAKDGSGVKSGRAPS